MGHPGPRILGARLGGPFIARKWKGAHDSDYLIDPDLEVARLLCETGPVTYMTIAPELPRGFELLDWLVGRGVIVSLGHTDADAATAHLAFNRGARAVTHLPTAQRRFTARDPGIIDMKDGDVIILHALKALKDAGQLDKMNVVVVMTGPQSLVCWRS